MRQALSRQVESAHFTLAPTDTALCTYDVTGTWSDEVIDAAYTTAQCFAIASGTITPSKD